MGKDCTGGRLYGWEPVWVGVPQANPFVFATRLHSRTGVYVRLTQMPAGACPRYEADCSKNSYAEHNYPPQIRGGWGLAALGNPP